ncbi:zinc metalloprotease [Culex quinquefasciatus]|uniref:Zinc metalloprotease n=1 Tax=Culex quinquefasciatus TaxID=7176 RepID=B0X1V7_CULQU|nr:zinc metalloprotease [Culex quinquefasciatus]|eukprot:XP_001863629.1 zinc metalloprotease [Culex quinquefasciatus]
MTSRVSAVGGTAIAPHLQPPNANHPVQALRTDDIEVQVIEQVVTTELHTSERKSSGGSGKAFGASKAVSLLAAVSQAANTASSTGTGTAATAPANGAAAAAAAAGRPSLKNPVGWVCCAPCIWLRGSSTVHKMAITAATLLVTSLLVASPILFLISAAPSKLPTDCYITEDDDCHPTPPPPPECADPICRAAAISIQTRMNWDVEPCREFKNYSCAPLEGNSLRAVKSPQEIADVQMQQLLSLNTTSGVFRKLGRLYGSCLRQTLNDSSIRMRLDKLGGYLQIGSVGPQSISPLISKIKNIGPMPIIGIYYDLSYGRKPQTLLIIDGPTTSSHILATEEMFEFMKQHLKRAPSLRGAALVRLSQLKVQAKVWPTLFNRMEIATILDRIEISSDNWFENVLKIYQLNKDRSSYRNISSESSHIAYAYPQIARIYYDSLSHSIVVPLSAVLVPYFNPVLPPYLHYATLGTAMAKEILRSITKAFESKVMTCVPSSVDIFSNASRMDLLIHSGGMQIAYHTLLSLTGPIKGMNRLPGLSLTPPQIFYLMSAQELCAESEYNGVDVNSNDFDEILTWLISQGGSASDVFQCHSSTMLSYQKNCDIW